jgi:uncharacterized phiE125 gp8 family phage protein
VLKVRTAATQEPLTLAETKVFLRVDVDADDALITSLIKAAREFAEHYTQTTLADVTYELALSAFPADAIELPGGGEVIIESINYRDAAGVMQTLDPQLYVLSDFGMTPFIYPLEAWPPTAFRPNSVIVRFTQAAAVPAAVRTAMLELVAHFYEDRENAASIPGCVSRLLDVPRVYR